MEHASEKESDLPIVIIVAYGAPDLLNNCLSTLGPGLDVVVVDNGRSPEIERLCGRLACRYVLPDRNLGFASAVNLALADDDSDKDVLLLNPDASVTRAGVIDLQRALRAQDRCAAVAPLLQRPNGDVERTAWPLPSPLWVWAGAFGLAGLQGRGRSFLSGAVLLLSRRALREIGGLDERFFLYAEETDWQLRAVRAGWSVKVVPAVTALHVGAGTSTSSETRDRYFHGSAELFARKWYGDLGWHLFRAGSLVAALRRTLLARDAEVRATQRRVIKLYLRGPARELHDMRSTAS